MNSEREIVNKLLSESKYKIDAIVLDKNDNKVLFNLSVDAKDSSDAVSKGKRILNNKYPNYKGFIVRQVRASLEEDASILPDKDDKKTIIRSEHHPINTSEMGNGENIS